jgi:hypothetical protein
MMIFPPYFLKIESHFFLCRLVIRGNQSDSAVLCTQNKTYEIRGAETSNLLLLLPKCLLSDEIPKETSLVHQEVGHLIFAMHFYEKIPIVGCVYETRVFRDKADQTKIISFAPAPC